MTRESRRHGLRAACALPTAVIALSAALVAGPASAGIERAGTTAANFLSIGSGAGVLGMGGAGLALEGGLATVHWNPATLARLDWSEAVLSHAALGEQSSQDWAAFGGRLRFLGVSGAVTGLYQGEGSFEGRDALNNPTGTFDVSSIALGLGVARAVGRFVTAGVALKYASEDLGTVRGSGVAFDAGLQVRSGPFGFGAAAQNALGRMTYDGASYDFPTSYGIGASCAHAASGLRVALDLNFPRAYYSDVRGGVEWNWNGHLALRTGYRAELGAPANEPLGGPTFGMGTGVRGIWIDYGYQVGGGGAGQHLLGVTFHPGALTLPTSQRTRGASESGYVSASTPATQEAERAKSTPTKDADRAASTPASGTTTTGSPTATPKTATPASAPATSTAAAPPKTTAPSSAPSSTTTAATAPKTAAVSSTPVASTATARPKTSAPASVSAPAITAAAPAKTAAAAGASAPMTTATAPVKPATATSAPATKTAASTTTTTATPTAPKAVATAGAATSLTADAAGPVAVNLSSTRPAAPPTYVQRTRAARATGDAASAGRQTAASDAGAGVAPRAPVAPASDARTTQKRDSTSAVKVTVFSPNPAAAAKPDSAAVRAGEPNAASSAQASQASKERSKPRPEKVRVKSGETMADIASRYGTSVPAIMMENNLVSDRARPGQVLKLPRK